MSRPKVSILVPIYNVEKYLRQCLDSIKNQTLDDIEVICINDGSTDKSPKIINEYVKEDRRFKVINKKNSGYGDSMNRGLAKATGEYIGIVESDDFIDANMFEEMYMTAVVNDADMVKTDFYFYFSNVSKSNPNWDERAGGLWLRNKNLFVPTNDIKGCKINPEDEGIFCPREDCEALFYKQPSIWSAIYRKSMLDKNDIKFLPTPGASYQDTSFAFKTALSANKVVLSSKAYLHYRQDNENSSVNSSSKVMCVVDEYKEMYRYLKEKKLDTPQMLAIVNKMKYKTYIWNLERLDKKSATQFMKVFMKEFNDDRQNKHMRYNKYTSYELRTVLEIMDHPEMYLKRVEARRNAKIALIIPSHNEDNYIGRALQSAVDQTMKDIEIICVDDGSTDLTVKVIDKYYAKDPRITVIEKTAGGVSSARNYGIDWAREDYLMFFDSDDKLEPTACEDLYHALVDNDVDIAVGRPNVIYESDANLWVGDMNYFSIYYPGKHQMDSHIIYETDDCCWGKLFRRSIINRCRMGFPDKLQFEDYYFVNVYLMMCKTMYGLDKPVLNYYRHKTGIMHDTFNNSLSMKPLDHFTIMMRMYYDMMRPLNLVQKYPDLTAQMFIDKVNAADRYLPEFGKQTLYRAARRFIKNERSYLDNIDPKIVRKMSAAIPTETAGQKFKYAVKHALHKLSRSRKLQLQTIDANYTHYKDLRRGIISLSNRIDELEKKSK